MSVRHVGPWALAIALVAASALVVLLSKRLRDLSADYREIRLRATLPYSGDVVPTFRTATLSGDSVTVGEAQDSATRQVLFVFNTTCPFCREILPLWHQMADSLRRLGEVEVLAISLNPADSTRLYIADHELRYPVLMFPQPKLKRLYRAAAVPQTVVLDGRGTVLYARTGTLDPPAVDSVFSAVAKRPARSP